MPSFTVGEEVLYDGDRFVIAGRSESPPFRYRLLASSRQGARMVWVLPQDLVKIAGYTTPRDDTASY